VLSCLHFPYAPNTDHAPKAVIILNPSPFAIMRRPTAVAVGYEFTRSSSTCTVTSPKLPWMVTGSHRIQCWKFVERNEATMTTVDFEPLTVAVPLWEEPAGVFRVGKSRLLLELVLRAFQRGETPEGIARSYRSLQLAEVYAASLAAIWRALRHSTSTSAGATRKRLQCAAS
jgi:hypothetical protein